MLSTQQDLGTPEQALAHSAGGQEGQGAGSWGGIRGKAMVELPKSQSLLGATGATTQLKHMMSSEGEKLNHP